MNYTKMSKSLERPHLNERNDLISDARSTNSDFNSIYNSSLSSTYKTTVVPRQLVIQRTLPRSSSTSRLHYVSQAMVPGVPFASTEVDSMRFSRVKEKKDMQDLNLRLCRYIDTVRFLEAQNKQLVDEIRNLKANWGRETSQVRIMFEADLEEARKIKDELEKERANYEIRLASVLDELDITRKRNIDNEQTIAKYRDTLEKQNRLIVELQANNGHLEKRNELLEGDKERDKKMIVDLKEAANRYKTDLDNQSLQYVEAENKKQSLEEELIFMKQIHEQQLKELSILSTKDYTIVNREFWKNEMEKALKDIQELYDEKMETAREESDTYYQMKIHEIRNSIQRNTVELEQAKDGAKKYKNLVVDLRDKVNRLEGQNSSLQNELDLLKHDKEIQERDLESENSKLMIEAVQRKAELESVWVEIDKIRSTKDSLELEIAAYRKLLEGEENRGGLKQVVEKLYDDQRHQGLQGFRVTENYSGDSDSSTSGKIKRENTSKTTFQRSAKGHVSITDCSLDGKFVIVENMGKKDESLSGHKVRRIVNGMVKSEFHFDKNYVLKSGAKIKIWASKQRPASCLFSDLEGDFLNWGVGKHITTGLYNQSGEERATHILTTISTD